VRDSQLLEQAAAIVELMPKAMRRLFALDQDDPTAELPVAQLRVCGILRDGPHTVSELSRELGVSLSAATQLAGRLEKSGLAERVHEQRDRRVRSLRLTEHGERVMRRRTDKRTARAAQVLAGMEPQCRAAVVRALRALTEQQHR